MRKLIYQLYNDNMISEEVVHLLLDKYYNKPSNYKDLMDFASEVSKLIRVPFASIDVYSTESGPLLGEITLTPGGIYYGEHYILSKAQERLMGRMWLEAKEELKL